MAEETNTPDTGVTLPEDLSGVDAKGLASLKSKIAKAFDKFREKPSYSGDDLAVMSALKDQMDQVKEAETAIQQAQAEAQAARDELIAAMDDEGGAEGGDGAEGSDAEGAEGVAPVVTIGEAAAGEESAEGGESEEPQGMEALAAAIVAAIGAGREAAPAGGEERAPAATSARPTIGQSAAAARAKAQRSAGPDYGAVSIVASSDTPGVQTGATLDNDGLTEAIMRRARSMGDSRGAGTKAIVASVQRTNPRNDIREVRGNENIFAAWEKAHNVEALVASGGWCSPSETTYDFACDYEAMPTTVDLPTLTAPRGGIIVPEPLKLSDFLTEPGIGMTWTEADDIAAATDPPGAVKVCAEIPCPEFMPDVRLEAFYTCLRAGNLVDRSWPELVNRVRDLALTAHAHRMNALKINKMVAASTALVTVLDTDLPATESVLAALEFQIAVFRDAEFTDEDFMIEVVGPRWLKHTIRRDLARVAGIPFNQVTDAEINSYFAEIGARVQWVTNYQMLAAGATSYPTSVQFMFYPAGAFTLLDGGELDLAVIRDSVLNETNDHTLLFFEEFFQIMERCDAYTVSVPICATGARGNAVTFSCPTA